MMQVFLIIIPTLLVSAYVCFVFGFLGICMMSSCLGSGNPIIEAKLLGAALVVVASAPLMASLAILTAHLRKKRLGSRARTLIVAVTVIVGGFGIFQMLVDPGDALWAGLPLTIVSALLAASMLSLRDP